MYPTRASISLHKHTRVRTFAWPLSHVPIVIYEVSHFPSRSQLSSLALNFRPLKPAYRQTTVRPTKSDRFLGPDRRKNNQPSFIQKRDNKYPLAE